MCYNKRSNYTCGPGSSGWFRSHPYLSASFESLWDDDNYSHWITTPLNEEEVKGGKVNSVQNGLLLRSDIHQLFDRYTISINPDVCIHLVFCIISNNYPRIIIRLYASIVMERVSLEYTLTKDLSMTPKDQLNSFYVGISGRLF
jgi:hypothetical protein